MPTVTKRDTMRKTSMRNLKMKKVKIIARDNTKRRNLKKNVIRAASKATMLSIIITINKINTSNLRDRVNLILLILQQIRF